MGYSLMLDSLFNYDMLFEICINNIVFFNDYYVGLINDCKIFLIVNMVFWVGYFGQGYMDGVL